MDAKRLQIFYTGRVQGVGFRYTVRQVAMGFEVRGIIRNLPDGRVELVVEGSKDELVGFQQAVRDSGIGRGITHEQELWSEPGNEFCGFEIVG